MSQAHVTDVKDKKSFWAYFFQAIIALIVIAGIILLVSFIRNITTSFETAAEQSAEE